MTFRLRNYGMRLLTYTSRIKKWRLEFISLNSSYMNCDSCWQAIDQKRTRQSQVLSKLPYLIRKIVHNKISSKKKTKMAVTR